MQKKSDVEKKIVDALSSFVKVQIKDIKGSSLLREELALDSMDTIELIFQIEDNYNIQIPDEDIMNFKTVHDVVQYVEKRIDES